MKFEIKKCGVLIMKQGKDVSPVGVHVPMVNRLRMWNK